MNRVARIATPVLIAAGFLVGCGSSPSGASPADIQIRLHMSGGFAGVDYAVLVDGRTGSVLGESCTNGCSFEAGQTLLGVTEAQIQNWIDRLLGAGILGLNGTDYGSECCDRFYADLTYSDGLGGSNVRGTADLMPAQIQSVVAEVSALITETLSVVVDPDLNTAALPADPLQLLSASIDGSMLTMDVEYGGGCKTHALGMFAGPEWLESFPVQKPMTLAHDARDDMCDALVRRTLRFRLSPVESAYEDAYPGETPGTRRVVLNISIPGSQGTSLTHTF